MNVFVSIGSVLSADQSLVATTIQSALTQAGLQPRPLAKAEWDDSEPIEVIKRAMGDCSGVLVIASARTQIANGSEGTKTGSLSLEGSRLTTVWNHIEAAVACALGLPLLVVAETGLKAEGFLEEARGWPVVRCPFSKKILEPSHKAELDSAIQSWKAALVPPSSLELPSGYSATRSGYSGSGSG